MAGPCTRPTGAPRARGTGPTRRMGRRRTWLGGAGGEARLATRAGRATHSGWAAGRRRAVATDRALATARPVRRARAQHALRVPSRSPGRRHLPLVQPPYLCRLHGPGPGGLALPPMRAPKHQGLARRPLPARDAREARRPAGPGDHDALGGQCPLVRGCSELGKAHRRQPNGPCVDAEFRRAGPPLRILLRRCLTTRPTLSRATSTICR